MGELLYDGFHKIEKVNANIKGKQVERERLHLPSGVAGLVIDTNNRIALVGQYRPTVLQDTKEIPAGILDKGLTPIETLLEELYEECELSMKDIITVDRYPFRKYFMETGSSNATTEIYLVHVNDQGYTVKNIEDDNDVDSIEWVTIDELEAYIKDGLIVDAKTLFAYEYAKSILWDIV